MEKSRIKLCLRAMIRLFSLSLRPPSDFKLDIKWSVYIVPLFFILPHQGVSPVWYL